MTESFDRELELVKLQIAAEDMYSKLQINEPLYFGTVIALFALVVSVRTEHLLDQVLILFISVLIILIVLYEFSPWSGRSRYAKGIRNLDHYIQDLRDQKPLPSIEIMCELKKQG